MEEYVITEHDELLTKEQAEHFGYKIVRKPTQKEIQDHEDEEEQWRKQSDQQQQEDSYHDLPD